MIELMCIEITTKDIWLLVLGGLVSLAISIAWTFFLFFSDYFKPNLKIELGDVEKSMIKVKVTNKGYKSAINLRVECCFFNIEEKFSYHLELDKVDFLLLLKGDDRVFKMEDITENAKKYNKTFDELITEFETKKCSIRVRVHAYHENSGFGKAFEQRFSS